MNFVADLERLLETTLITDPDITATYSKDQAPFAVSQPAAAVLLARSTEEISKALTFCSERNVPVVTRGAGSGLSGGANADSRSLVISLEKMNQILEIDLGNQLARVQAGVINLDLDTAVKSLGWPTYLIRQAEIGQLSEEMSQLMRVDCVASSMGSHLTMFVR